MLKEGIIKFLKLETMVENLTGFVETRIELMKLELKEDISKVVSKIIVYVVAVLIFTFFLLFLSLAVAMVLSDKLGDFWGFGVVGFFYFALGATLLLLRKSISKKIEVEIGQLIKRK